MSVRLYVGNLPFSVSEQQLEELFGQIGVVESANLVTDRDTGRSRGFAFVEMDSREAADAAIAELNGREIDGRQLTVNEARPRENRATTRRWWIRWRSRIRWRRRTRWWWWRIQP